MLWDIRSSLDQRLSLSSLFGEFLVSVSDVNHPVGHRVLGSGVLDIRPELDLDVCSSLVKVGRDRQHTSLTGGNSLVNREQSGTERSDPVGQDVLGGINSCRSGWDLDSVSITFYQQTP
jgi:hypothetical protein